MRSVRTVLVSIAAAALTGILFCDEVCGEVSIRRASVWPVPVWRQAIVIGVDRYADKDLPTLHGAKADARAMAEYFRSGGFNDVLTLTDAKAMRKAILSYASSRPKLPVDRLHTYIYFSGHAVRASSGDSASGYLLCPHDYDPAREPSRTGISVADLVRASAAAGPDQLVIIIDANGPTEGDVADILEAGAGSLTRGGLVVVWAASVDQRAEQAAGRHGEDSVASGVFTKALLAELRARAVENGRQRSDVDLGELLEGVQKRMTGNTRQRPMCFGLFRDRCPRLPLPQAATTRGAGPADGSPTR